MGFAIYGIVVRFMPALVHALMRVRRLLVLRSRSRDGVGGSVAKWMYMLCKFAVCLLRRVLTRAISPVYRLFRVRLMSVREICFRWSRPMDIVIVRICEGMAADRL